MSTKHFCIATAAQPLCKDRDTYFCAAVDGIAPEYKSADGEVFRPEASIGSVIRKGVTNIVTPTYGEWTYQPTHSIPMCRNAKSATFLTNLSLLDVTLSDEQKHPLEARNIIAGKNYLSKV